MLKRNEEPKRKISGAKTHKRGRLSSELDRRRMEISTKNQPPKRKRTLVTHRINYYAIKHDIHKDGTQSFLFPNTEEE